MFRNHKGNKAYVIYIPDIGAPSTASTVAWIQTVTKRDCNYFEDSPHIILDALKGHFAEETQIEWEQIGATLYRLPASTGKWLNPCDQAINREIRRTFLKLQQLDNRKKLENIITAYYSVKDETVRACFDHCGLFGGDPEDIISAQASQGFGVIGNRRNDFEKYTTALFSWMGKSIRYSTDILPRGKTTDKLDSNLDGKYWDRYAMK